MAIVFASALLPIHAFAAGFQIWEQSVRGLGRANAGSAALAENASTIFFNPAGLMRLSKTELLGGFSIIDFNTDFDRITTVDAIGQPLSGGEGGDIGDAIAVPSIYFAMPINEKMAWGIALNVPFGLTTEYDSDSVFRYQAIKSEITNININPSFAYRINDVVSLGVGLNWQRMDVELTNAVDYGAVCFGAVDPVTCTSLGLLPQSLDGFARLEADSDAFGWNLGVLVETGETRFGFSYRSRIDHDLEGDATFTNAPALFTALGLFTNTGARADFETPEIWILSFAHDLGENWIISADIARTGWDTFQELRVRFDNPAQPDTVQVENWKDSYKFAVGVDYQLNDKWILRGGAALDESPIPEEFRAARLPSDDRYWLSFGASYASSDKLTMNIGYAHLFVSDNIFFDQTSSTGDRVVGIFEADVDILGFEVGYQFD
ncbi:MAG: outer membrane protein transport protein [Gammaproteobacteria bacterium]